VSFKIGSPVLQTVDGFDYPIGSRSRYTEARDGDGWYSATEYNELCLVKTNPNVWKYHLGEDWNAESGYSSDLGQPVYAIANGTVVFSEPVDGTWGNVLIIRHQMPDGSQMESLYGHVQKLLKSKDSVVKRGDLVATIGDANGVYADAAHLHFEIRTQSCTDWWGFPGKGYSFNSNVAGWVDPSDFIDANRPASGTADQAVGALTSLYDPTTKQMGTELLIANVETSDDVITGANGWAVVDGDTNTAWRGQQESKAWWIVITLDALTSIVDINTRIGSGSATNMVYRYSVDGVDFPDLSAALSKGPVDIKYLWLIFAPTENGEVPIVEEVQIIRDK
jgi:murein DD-endopeptidase MepM/ murein hydrolase activator NlpD